MKKIKQYYLLKYWPKLSKEAIVFERLGYEYGSMIYDLISTISYQCGSVETVYSTFKDGTNQLICMLPDNNPLFLLGYHTQNHIFHISGYHYLPNDSLVQKYIDQNYKFLFIVRNHLDTVLSFASKSIGKDKDGIAQGKFNEVLLDRFERVKEYFDELRSKKDLGLTIKYEDLIHNPIEQINQLTKIMGLNPKNKISEKIWNESGFKLLPGIADGHFWKGGIGKYREFLNEQIMALFNKLGANDLLLEYGYKEISNDFLQKIAAIKQEYDLVNLTNELKSQLDNYPIVRKVEDEDNRNCLSVGELVVYSKNHEARAKFADIISDKYIYNLLAAGKLQASPVSQAYTELLEEVSEELITA